MITLFIPLSGKDDCWELLSAYLERQAYPHKDISLLFLNTSLDSSFQIKIKEWGKTCDYGKFYVINIPLQQSQSLKSYKLWRVFEYIESNRIMCYIYNLMRGNIKTDLVWIIEDDVIPPDDALSLLLAELGDDVFSVSGVYKDHYNDNYIVWKDSTLLQPLLSELGSGVEAVEGNGLGCVLMRVKEIASFTYTPPEFENTIWGYDMEFYFRGKYKALVHWGVVCSHILHKNHQIKL